MNKKCTRCLKTVYPLEELKCFDKIWHKSCFRCTECGMMLTLKNYRGHDRMPYCSAHVPKLQATQIASTPELKRLTNNTRIQSDRKYHEDYERAKLSNQSAIDGSEKSVSKENTKVQANVAYHVCKFEHKNIVEKRKRELDEIAQKNLSNGTSSGSERPSLINLYKAKQNKHKSLLNSDSYSSSYNSYSDSSKSSLKLPNRQYIPSRLVKRQTESKNSIESSDLSLKDSEKYISPDEPKKTRLMAGNTPDKLEDIYVRRGVRGDTASISSVSLDIPPPYDYPEGTNYWGILDDASASNITIRRKSSPLQISVPPPNPDGKVPETFSFKDLKSVADFNNIQMEHQQMEDPHLENQQMENKEVKDQQMEDLHLEHQQMENKEVKDKQIEDKQMKDQQMEHKKREDQQMENQLDEPSSSSPRNSPGIERKPSKTELEIYRAAFPFEAREPDEVSFVEGDLIYEVERENSGWITGRVARTGKIGMLPITYMRKNEDRGLIENLQEIHIVENINKTSDNTN